MANKNKNFSEKAVLKHGNKYDYSNFEYIDAHTKGEIICKKHGSFWQTPNNHLQGKGCRECSYELRGKQKASNTDTFCLKVSKQHNNIYDYSEVDYVNNFTKVKIRCKKHNHVFEQTPASHLRGAGCPICAKEKLAEIFKDSKEEYIQKARNVHGYWYSYLKTDYINNNTEIIITCREHGDFEQLPYVHLSGCGCKKCGMGVISKSEIELHNFIINLGYEIKTSDRKTIKPLELDIFIPSLNKALEFNGEWWHYNHNNPNCKPKGYHAMKSNLCKHKGIKLLHIREDLWLKNKEFMKQVIINFLNK